MAGVEKICEYSGKYVGFNMYKFKKNFIQIHPDYIKEFNNKKIYLIIFGVNITFGSIFIQKLINIDYAIYCPEVLGKVNGLYINTVNNSDDLIKTVNNIEQKLIKGNIYPDYVLCLNNTFIDDNSHDELIDIINKRIKNENYKS